MLRVYKDNIGNNEPVDREYDTQFMFNDKYYTFDDIGKSKTKFFYKNLVQHKFFQQNVKKNMMDGFNHDIDFEYVYKCKIVNIRDKKLDETNFKIMHGILPCNVNLVKW